MVGVGLMVGMRVGSYYCMRPDHLVSQFYYVRTRTENFMSELYSVGTNLLGMCFRFANPRIENGLRFINLLFDN